MVTSSSKPLVSSLLIIFKMGDFIGHLGYTNLNTFTSAQFHKTW